VRALHTHLAVYSLALRAGQSGFAPGQHLSAIRFGAELVVGVEFLFVFVFEVDVSLVFIGD
jgi:hypothetical protein